MSFWGRLDQNCGFHGNRKPPYNGENGVSTFSWLFFDTILFILAGNEDLQKSPTSANFGQIGPLTMELAALEV